MAGNADENAGELAEARRALGACRTALAGLRDGVAALEREMSRIEETLERADRPGGALLALGPQVGRIESLPEPRDWLVERVDQLCRGCEALLQRGLRGDERPVVLGWAQLERNGEPVPVAEILALTRYLLSRPTPEGTLPGTLRWCESTVQTLSRAPLRSLGPGGRSGRAAQLSALYDRLADELDAKEAP